MTSSAANLGFASAAARLTSARMGARERRRFRRVPLVVGGRMLDPIGREHDCRTADVSPGDVRVITPLAIEVGHRVILYFENLGRVSGHVVRQCAENELAIVFDSTPHKREKLAETITWMMNRGALGLDEAPRPGPREGPHLARLEVETGEIVEGEVLDLSLAGMTVSSRRPAPPLGTWIRFGGVYGRVARLLEGGFAIDFEPRGGRPQTD